MTATARIPATERTAARLLIPAPARFITANYKQPQRIQNEERTRLWRAAAADHWRTDYAADWIAPPIEITAWQLRAPTAGPAHDPGNIYPTLKAAIDGLRDAGAIGADTADWIAAITMLAHSPAPEPALFITLETTGRREPPPGHNPNTYYR